VPGIGIEPTRPCGHRILSPARLPVPPARHADSIASKQVAGNMSPKCGPSFFVFLCALAVMSATENSVRESLIRCDVALDSVFFGPTGQHQCGSANLLDIKSGGGNRPCPTTRGCWRQGGFCRPANFKFRVGLRRESIGMSRGQNRFSGNRHGQNHWQHFFLIHKCSSTLA
jgi:hypothetical protein